MINRTNSRLRSYFRFSVAFSFGIALASCTATQATSPIVIPAVTLPSGGQSVEQQIVSYCVMTGLFKPLVDPLTGVATSAVPKLEIPVKLIQAGIDQVCANPALIGQDVNFAKTVIDVLKNVFVQRRVARLPTGQ